jgi:hypothetical protein
MISKDSISWQNPMLNKIISKIIETSVYLARNELANPDKIQKIYSSFVEDMFPRSKTEISKQ